MKSCLISIVVLFSINTMASDGSSGCGPGWYVFKENSILSSSLRVTTNAIFFPTTTLGMTLGTSNCSKHKLVRTEKESLHFAISNFYELKAEIAKGNGEFLTAFSQVLGCKSHTQKAFNKKLKKNFEEIFKTEVPANSLREIYRVILQDTELVNSCSLS